MPPWARQPTTSYWALTTSPEASLGLNENGAPHVAQKPSVRPGWSPRDRPTGSLQRAQKRRLSATSGASITAPAGSRCSTGSTSTSPTPNRRRTAAVRDPFVRREGVEGPTGAVAGPWGAAAVSPDGSGADAGG